MSNTQRYFNAAFPLNDYVLSIEFDDPFVSSSKFDRVFDRVFQYLLFAYISFNGVLLFTHQ